GSTREIRREDVTRWRPTPSACGPPGRTSNQIMVTRTGPRTSMIGRKQRPAASTFIATLPHRPVGEVAERLNPQALKDQPVPRAGCLTPQGGWA
ncbi:MAG: hypothetical protein WBO53_05800, partial [Thermoanaerobaculia bacterium]